MKNSSKNRNIFKTKSYNIFLNHNPYKKDERFISEISSPFNKELKIKSKNLQIKNLFNKSNLFKNLYLASKTLNKMIAKNNCEKTINYKNYGRSFLFPDYKLNSNEKVLKDLKAIGSERTIKKYFSKDNIKKNYINNKKTNIKPNKFKYKSITNSKYLNLINYIRASNTSYLKGKNIKTNYINTYSNNNTYYGEIKKRLLFKNRIKKEIAKDNKDLFYKGMKKNNNYLLTGISFYYSNLNTLSLNTSCDSKNLYDIKLITK